jgi:hypothetical protein
VVFSLDEKLKSRFSQETPLPLSEEEKQTNKQILTDSMGPIYVRIKRGF